MKQLVLADVSRNIYDLPPLPMIVHELIDSLEEAERFRATGMMLALTHFKRCAGRSPTRQAQEISAFSLDIKAAIQNRSEAKHKLHQYMTIGAPCRK
jgi:hypothetical protein